MSDEPVKQDPATDAEHDQTLAELDQSITDGDQTAADLDQSAADRDEAASEQDQLAADRDQVAADFDEASARDRGDEPMDGNGYARSRRARAKSGRDREAASRIRAESAVARDDAATRRDQIAAARDTAARARDELAARLDADLERLALEDSVEGAASSNGADACAGCATAGVPAWAAAGRRRSATRPRMTASWPPRTARRRRATATSRRQNWRRRASTDLTGAMLRRVGLGAIQRELDRTKRSGEPLVVAYVDVDGLKAVNDTAGHMAGDALLSSVADSISHDLRSYDVICRFGGDEFLCSLTGQDAGGARKRFQQIGTRLSTATSGATISVGFAERAEDDTVEALVGRADAELIETRRGLISRHLAAEPLRDEHGGAEDERGDGDRGDGAGGEVRVMAAVVQNGVALAARDQPAVDRVGDDAGDDQRERERAPEQDVADPGGHRAGDEQHDRVVDDLHDRDAEGVGGEGDRDDGRQRHPGPQQRQAGERVAEEERQRDGERHSAPLGEAQGGPDHHADDLADRAAGEAVQGRAQRDGVQRAARRR